MKFAIFKNLFWAFVFLFLYLSILLTGAVAKSAESAELILYNGFVWTVDEAKLQAEAIAVRGDKIIKVGKNAEILALKDKNTRLIDLKGAFVVPGFNDNHVHFASAAQFFWNIQLMDVHADASFIARVREYVALRPNEPIRGGGWSAYEQWELGASKSGEKAKEAWMPDRRLIDSLTGNTPMFVSKFDNSLYFANSAALKNAGISEDSADTDEIKFFRDAKGRLTGTMQIKNPRGLEAKFLGGDQRPDHKKRTLMTENVLRMMAAVGVSSFQDISDHEQLQLFYELLERDRLTARVNFRYGIEFWEI